MSIRVDPNGFPQERVHRSVISILRGNVLCSIATVTGENKAHINTAYFCYSDDLELYFLSDPGSLHCRNLSTNSSMAVTVFRSSQSWGGPDEGLQLFGTCTQARGSQATKAQRLYVERFPTYAKWLAGLRNERVGPGYRFFRFLTERLKMLDERNFGEAVIVTAAVTRDRR